MDKFRELAIVYRVNLIVTPIAILVLAVGSSLPDQEISNLVIGIGLALIIPMGTLVLLKAIVDLRRSFNDNALLRRNSLIKLASSPLPATMNRYVRLARGRFHYQVNSLKSLGNVSIPEFGTKDRISKRTLVAVNSSDGVSLSTTKEGIIVQVPFLACNVQLGDGGDIYRCTRSVEHGELESLNIKKLLRFSKNGFVSGDIDYLWLPSSRELVHDVLLGKVKNGYRDDSAASDGRISRHELTLLRFRPIFYSLSEVYQTVYSNLLRSLSMVASDGCWYNRETWENVGIERWKGQAGTRYTVDRRKARIVLESNNDVQFNMDVAHFMLGGASYVVLPDTILCMKSGVSHPLKSVQVFTESSQFVMSESSVPNGSQILDYTWEYVNRDGSPDLRYSENARRAIIRIHEISIVADEKVIYSIVFASETAAEGFAAALAALSDLARS